MIYRWSYTAPVKGSFDSEGGHDTQVEKHCLWRIPLPFWQFTEAFWSYATSTDGWVTEFFLWALERFLLLEILILFILISLLKSSTNLTASLFSLEFFNIIVIFKPSSGESVLSESSSVYSFLSIIFKSFCLCGFCVSCVDPWPEGFNLNLVFWHFFESYLYFMRMGVLHASKCVSQLWASARRGKKMM